MASDSGDCFRGGRLNWGKIEEPENRSPAKKECARMGKGKKSVPERQVGTVCRLISLCFYERGLRSDAKISIRRLRK